MVHHILTFNLTTADFACFTTVGKQKGVGLHDTVFLDFGFGVFGGGIVLTPRNMG